MAKILYSDTAIQDLEKIGDYIAEKLKNPIAALNTVSGIQDSIDKLEDFPSMGAPLSSVARISSDYRFLVSGSYLVFYREQEDSVYIDRVLYGKRDYLSLLFDSALERDAESTE